MRSIVEKGPLWSVQIPMGNRLSEVKCPRCGAWVDVFVIMGGAIGKTGTLVADEHCVCGCVLPAGSFLTEYEE